MKRIKEFEKLEGLQKENYEMAKEKERKEMDLFKEDWQLSQFWYSNSTAETLARALLEGADKDTHIAVVSAPSVYAAQKMRGFEEVHNWLPVIWTTEFGDGGREHFVFL